MYPQDQRQALTLCVLERGARREEAKLDRDELDAKKPPESESVTYQPSRRVGAGRAAADESTKYKVRIRAVFCPASCARHQTSIQTLDDLIA